MVPPSDMIERHGLILAELAQAGLALALDLQARALAADTPEQAASLAQAFHAVGRSVRQTLALEARLHRDHQRAEREDRLDAQRQANTRNLIRKAQLRSAVEGVIWTEYEGTEAENLLDDLDHHLDEAILYDDFTSDPVEAHIHRICSQLDLKTEGSNPLSPSATAPPNGEQLAAQDPPPGQSPIRGRWPEGPEGVEAHSALPNSTHDDWRNST